MAQIIPFGERSRRDFHAVRRGPRILPLIKRLQILKDSKVRAPLSSKRQRYLAQAEEFRMQAETFRDPTTQSQVLRLAAICENWARRIEE